MTQPEPPSFPERDDPSTVRSGWTERRQYGQHRLPRVRPPHRLERRIAGLTQSGLARDAGVALGTIRKIERGERGVSGAVLSAVADELGIAPCRLLPDLERPYDRAHQAMPGLSCVLAEYEAPEDGPCRERSSLPNCAAPYTPLHQATDPRSHSCWWTHAEPRTLLRSSAAPRTSPPASSASCNGQRPRPTSRSWTRPRPTSGQRSA
ncbi:helix-turn-helix domain-containing protein [Streptomyces sp. NPDC101150]|uniref:helix-turn-helix domain-containing protein n=1 Tax=Streptomyces sp. NPDC101150 TaxID=3366114 RepID=UPI003812F009